MVTGTLSPMRTEPQPWGATLTDPLLDHTVWGGAVRRWDPDWYEGLLYAVADDPGRETDDPPVPDEERSSRSYRVEHPAPPALSRLLARTGLLIPAIYRECVLELAAWRGYLRSLLAALVGPTTPEDDVPALNPERVETELPPPPAEDDVLVATLAPNAPPAALSGGLGA